MTDLSTDFLIAKQISAELIAEKLRMPDVWDQAERFRPYCSDAQEPIERPGPVEDLCRPLTASLYPDCPLCRRDVNGCECDPDEVSEALWLQFKSNQGGSNV